jgi:hypothetical protein
MPFSDSPKMLTGSFLLMVCLLMAGGQLDAIVLYGMLDLRVWTACVVNGMILTMYVMENWAMLREIQSLSDTIQTHEATRQFATESLLRTKVEMAETLLLLKDENVRLRIHEATPTAPQRCIECWNRRWHSTPPQSPELRRDEAEQRWVTEPPLKTPSCAPAAS